MNEIEAWRQRRIEEIYGKAPTIDPEHMPVLIGAVTLIAVVVLVNVYKSRKKRRR